MRFSVDYIMAVVACIVSTQLHVNPYTIRGLHERCEFQTRLCTHGILLRTKPGNSWSRDGEWVVGDERGWWQGELEKNNTAEKS